MRRKSRRNAEGASLSAGKRPQRSGRFALAECENRPVFVSARLGLLKVLRIEHEVIYSKCREFRSGSLVISHMKAR
jgi:hypothetical protein